jgi:5-methylcytosine-specific restriction endonuclease McrA
VLYSKNRRRIYACSEYFNKYDIYERHNWICIICGDEIDPTLKFPHLEAATLEHIIPLCRGGTHTIDNVGPAHASCNFIKGDKLLGEL